MYLDTADVKVIETFIKYKWISGVTTNPTLLNKIHAQNREQIINDILDRIGNKKIFVQLSGKDSNGLVADAINLIEEYENEISLKVQIDSDGLEAIETIKERYPNVGILGTVIFSSEQAYLAGLAGCDWIAPYFNRMENQSIDASKMIKKIRKLYNDHSINTKIMGASFKNSKQIMDALLTGADDVTVPADLLSNMMDNKLASDSIIQFNQDANKVHNK